MSNIWKYLVIGGLCLGGGGVAGYLIAKKRYEHLADVECQSIIESFEKNGLIQNVPKKEEKKKEKVDDQLISKKSYENDVKAKYQDYAKPYQTVQTDAEKAPQTEVITSYDFHAVTQKNDIKQETLIYYSDGVLADDDYNQVNVENTVGEVDLKRLFKTNDDDVIYIRNYASHTDYEVIYDERTWDSLPPKYKNLAHDEYN